MGYVGTQYNPEIWSDMTHEEKMAYHIYEEFQKEYNKLVAQRKLSMKKWLPDAGRKMVTNYERDGKYPADFIREHENWETFVKTYEKYQHMTTFDPVIFMKGAFYYRDEMKKFYPAMLLTDTVEKSYYKYIEKIVTEARMGNTGDEVIRGLMGTRRAICKLLRIHDNENPDFQDIYDLFNTTPKGHIVSRGISFALSGMFSLYYLAMSKSFNSAYDKLDQDIKSEIGFDSREDMEPFIGVVRQFPEALKTMKILFGDDIV
jgi:hypothetical protein